MDIIILMITCVFVLVKKTAFRAESSKNHTKLQNKTRSKKNAAKLINVE